MASLYQVDPTASPAPRRSNGSAADPNALAVVMAYHYPPDTAVGGVRPMQLAARLANAGFRVRVITAERADDRRADDTRGSSIEVRPVAVMPSLITRLLALRDELRPPATGVASHPPEIQTPAGLPGVGLVATLRRYLLSLLWLPDNRQGFIVPAALAAVDGPDRPDLLVTSGPPFSVHLAGLLASLLTRVRWIVEFRDPWTDNPSKSADSRSALSEAVERWLERLIINRADGVVTLTQSHADMLRPRMQPGRRHRVVVSPNGIDSLRVGGAMGTSRPIRIVYTGDLYLARDPRPFFQGLGTVCRRQGWTPADLQVDFIGEVMTFHGMSVAEMARKAGVAEFVHLLGRLPADQCREVQDNAALLLLLAQGQPAQVPQKLYDYLGTRRPILAFVDQDGESARILRAVGGHHILSEAETDEAAADRIAEAIASAQATEPRGDAAVLASLTREARMQPLLDLAFSTLELPRGVAARPVAR